MKTSVDLVDWKAIMEGFRAPHKRKGRKGTAKTPAG
ncbi:hypothetical protein HBHAL_2352 [Halobacillus halophilus DSM 2266]|uniref:Uncharacterized protein n=1 Tax=Halobacillus halophilus (strain ATCC 35676 / DSM 2266 / JCM 20832 / KCTC 3685 / LMG 17431 / NBRC 102448 / NCIMB 2269) TaxID=866895 RepID=I0JKM9_HALH3|nr:hypothetical protein HBHAL_2352 [Halobacillus halophilus DSM 2266]